MGRPRKPSSLKILDGDQPCRINGSEPQSPPGLGDPPDWLDPVALVAWARVAALLEPMGIATRADSEVIATYCEAFSTWRKALARVDAEGLTIETDTTTKPHPCLAIANEARRQMNRVFARFGMTPADRATLHIQAKPEDDELLSFLMHPAPKRPEGKGRP